MDIKKYVRPNILSMKPYASARDEFKGAASIYLDANENPYETGLNRYPDPLAWAVKQALAPIKGVAADNIFLGNGSDEVIDVLIRIFCEPRQDNIVILPPTYGMYAVNAETSDVGIVSVNLTPDFDLDTEGVLKAATDKSKILFICSPNNPTGNALTLEKIEFLIQNFDGIVVVDEAYSDFSPQTALNWVGKYPNLVVMQTFSKAWGLAAIRLGMAFASTDIIGLMNKVKPPYNVNELTQQAALDALKNVENMKKQVAELSREREKLAEILRGLPVVEKVYPSDANFVLVKMTDGNAVYQHLLTRGIVTRNRSNVVLCENGVRISVGTPAENEAVVEALRG